MKTLRTFAALLISGAILWSCETEGLYEVSIVPEQSVTLSNGIAIHDIGRRRIMYLEAKPGDASISQLYAYKSDERIEWLRPGPSASNPTELFAMSLPTDKRDTSVKETLIRINGKNKATQKYSLDSSFENITFDTQGKFAVLTHGEKGKTDGGVYNPNEVALVDLEKAPGDDNPKVITADMGSRRVSGVTFLPEVKVAGKSMNLVVFLARGSIRIADINSPSDTSILIPLVTKDDPRTVFPSRIITRSEDDSRDSMIFVLASGSEDIYAISLSEDAAGDGLLVTLNQFEAGGNPTDMLVAEDGETPLLVVLSTKNGYGISIVNVVKIDTSETFSIQVDDRVENAFVNEESPQKEIVLYGNNSNGVHFLSIDNLSSEKGRNLDDLMIPDRVSRAMLLDTKRLLVVTEKTEDMVILNLDTRKSTRLSIPQYVNWDESQAFKDSFYFISEDAEQVDIVDLNTEHPHSLLLDDRASSLHLLNDSGVGVVLHEAPSGRATIFNLENPERDNALVVDGIWLDGFLGEKEAGQ